jgi:regulator of PEP synthase PpsR (kinase-PPPase family)
MYLSTMGWKVGNVPLVKGLQPPASLYEIDHRRVIGLTIEPGQLVAHRRRRGQHIGLHSNAAYSTPADLIDELAFAQEIFRKGRFATVDTTDKPIEESADEIITRVKRELNFARE